MFLAFIWMSDMRSHVFFKTFLSSQETRLFFNIRLFVHLGRRHDLLLEKNINNKSLYF